MNTWPAMVSSRLLLFSPAIFMLIAVVLGQPAFDLNCSSGESDCTAKRTSDACFQHRLRRSSLSSYSNGFYNTCTGEDSDIVYGQALRRGYVNSTVCRICIQRTATKEILKQCISEDAMIFELCQVPYPFRLVRYDSFQRGYRSGYLTSFNTSGLLYAAFDTLLPLPASQGKARNSTSRYVVLTVAVLLTVTSVVLLIVSTGIYVRAKMRKNVGVVTGTMRGEGNEELLTMGSPVNMVPSQPKKNKGRRSWFACFAFHTESMTMGSQQKVSQSTGTSQYSSKLQEALDKFDTGSNDSQPVSHFYCFDGYLEKFLRFTIPREGVPLLEKLCSRYGDFTVECRLENMAGSMFLKLLSAVLLDIGRVPLKDLDITCVCEWRDALKEVLAAGFDIGFLLGHLRHMIVEFHNHPSEQELAELEATIRKKEAELLEIRARKDRLVAACSSFGVGSCFDHILI